MAIFRAYLIFAFLGILILTLSAVIKDGPNLIPFFLDPIMAMGWQGQFNFDFSTYLMLTAGWVAWRGRFSGASLVLAVMCGVLGIFFFAPYLLHLSYQTKGDVVALLRGQN